MRELYIRAWEQLLAVSAGVPPAAWRRPSPCPDWTAQQLAGHVVDGAGQIRGWLDTEPRLPETDPGALAALAGDDPARTLRHAVQPLLRRVADLGPGATVTTPQGTLPVDAFLAVAMVEPAVHAWDLATATGQSLDLDSGVVTALLDEAERMGDGLAATGMYAAARPVDPAAAPQERLLALLGRTR
jgi:uncharacterized protein (TIGR03086 family)